MYISFPFYVVVYLNSNQLQQKRIADKKKNISIQKHIMFLFSCSCFAFAEFRTCICVIIGVTT